MENFKYTKESLKEILNKGLATGADFVELFFEDTISERISYSDSKASSIDVNNTHGVAARLIKDEQVVFAYSNDFEDAEKLVVDLAKSFNGNRKTECMELKEVEKDVITTCKINPTLVEASKKVELLDKIDKSARESQAEVVQVMGYQLDKYQEIIVCNTNGIYANDIRTNIRIGCNAVASDGKDMQSGSADLGGNTGFEFFNEENEKGTFEEMGKKAALQAVTMLHADFIKGGKMTVVMNNGFGGVILHEACVHSLEATSVAKGASVFCGKLGQKIASDIVTAVDDGTLNNYWGSTNVDDEGHKTQRNVLIENGILKSYLVDYKNAKKMNHPTTGSGRRESYKYMPTSRMTNTFFVNGKSTPEEIIQATEYGLYCASMGGGSVEPATGEFNFSVREAYLIENGKLTKPIKGATLVGSGKDVLLNVDMIGNNLLTAHGMCGSESGSVPTDVGQPTIRVQNITVGGKNDD